MWRADVMKKEINNTEREEGDENEKGEIEGRQINISGQKKE